jgi:hypothetical protein
LASGQKRYARAHDISASDTIDDSGTVPEMFITDFMEQPEFSGGGVIVQIRIDFAFFDVFDRENTGKAYFSAYAMRNMGKEGPEITFLLPIAPIVEPTDWGTPDYAEPEEKAEHAAENKGG